MGTIDTGCALDPVEYACVVLHTLIRVSYRELALCLYMSVLWECEGD